MRRIFLIATEESGDRLGAGLMKILRQRLGDAVQFDGVGGRAMAREGLSSLFPIEELSIMGFTAVAARLPKILRLIRHTADAVIAAAPDVLGTAVREGLAAAAGKFPTLKATLDHLEHFRPGKPMPTHRYKRAAA